MNTFNAIHKHAGLGDWVKMVSDGGSKLYAALAASLFGAGLAGGHVAARITAPSAVKENSDKILTSEALATEIDVTERKIKDLERRRAALTSRKTADTQAYDRFV